MTQKYVQPTLVLVMLILRRSTKGLERKGIYDEPLDQSKEMGQT